MTEPTQQRRAGFVAVLGAPNVGKSTLTNRLTGSKVSIVSPKVQTTRTRVFGIALHATSQVILVDTPGIFAPRRRLDRAMVAAAWQGAADADLVLLLVDAPRGLDDETRAVLDALEQRRRPAIAVLNKVDAVADKTQLLALASELDGRDLFTQVFMISALDGTGVADLLAFLAQALPVGPWLFPEDQVSDMPERLLAAEITREQLYHQLRQELPYRTTVETEAWQDRDDGSVRIDQVVYVQKEGHKRILLGRGGAQIKAIGAAARRELEALMGCRLHLFLFVKVREKWEDDPARYRYWGLDPDSR